MSNGDLVSDSIDSKDLSAMTHVNLWVYVSTAVAAGDLALLLDNTANCASPVETITLPAISARTWTFVQLALANPEDDTAIISIGLEYNANAAANDIWLDEIVAVNHDKSDWIELPKHLWWIDKENNDLVFSLAGVQTMGYSLMKLSGGSVPTALSSDTDVCDIPEQFVIARATALLLMGGSQGREADTFDRRGLAAYWDGRAQQERNRFPVLMNVRKL